MQVLSEYGEVFPLIVGARAIASNKAVVLRTTWIRSVVDFVAVVPSLADVFVPATAEYCSDFSPDGEGEGDK